MKNFTALLISALALNLIMTSCSTPKALQTQPDYPRVENHLKGDIDYIHGALDLVQRQVNGEEIILGRINTDGTINFTLPEFDIKALYDSLNYQPYKLQGSFLMASGCKDKDVFAETPFDNLYLKKYDLLIKKYGINVATLEAGNDSLRTSSTYHWFNIDRAIRYTDECIKITPGTDNIYAKVSANIQFEMGWNFIEETYETIQNKTDADSITSQIKNTHFTKSSPSSKKVKWFLRQIQEDEKIQTAKKLFNLTPITKEQFEKWAPDKLGDLSASTKEHGNPPRGLKNKNNIHLIYSNEPQKKEIDLYVVDCAKNPNDMEMINFSYAMENRGKDEKDIKPYIAQYKEEDKTTMIMYKVGDRIIVSASGVNIDEEAMWDHIQQLNVDKLIKK